MIRLYLSQHKTALSGLVVDLSPVYSSMPFLMPFFCQTTAYKHVDALRKIDLADLWTSSVMYF